MVMLVPFVRVNVAESRYQFMKLAPLSRLLNAKGPVTLALVTVGAAA